jgi:hypothetical protein
MAKSSHKPVRVARPGQQRRSRSSRRDWNRPKIDPAREERITMDVVVDADDPSERATAWFGYLERELEFPFTARVMRGGRFAIRRRRGRGRFNGAPTSVAARDVCHDPLGTRRPRRAAPNPAEVPVRIPVGVSDWLPGQARPSVLNEADTRMGDLAGW